MKEDHHLLLVMFFIRIKTWKPLDSWFSSSKLKYDEFVMRWCLWIWKMLEILHENCKNSHAYQTYSWCKFQRLAPLSIQTFDVYHVLKQLKTKSHLLFFYWDCILSKIWSTTLIIYTLCSMSKGVAIIISHYWRPALEDHEFHFETAKVDGFKRFCTLFIKICKLW